jgi:hypothetical protein
MRVSTILAIAGLALFAVTGASNAQDMNGMQGIRWVKGQWPIRR